MYFDIPSSYTVEDVGAKSVIKKIGKWKDASDCNGDKAGRQHPTITIC
jgi:hypothetical protein